MCTTLLAKKFCCTLQDLSNSLTCSQKLALRVLHPVKIDFANMYVSGSTAKTSRAYKIRTGLFLYLSFFSLEVTHCKYSGYTPSYYWPNTPHLRWHLSKRYKLFLTNSFRPYVFYLMLVLERRIVLPSVYALVLNDFDEIEVSYNLFGHTCKNRIFSYMCLAASTYLKALTFINT